MAARKTASTRRAATRTSTRARRTTRRRTRSRTTTRRRRPALSTTLGAALGTLVVSTLLQASWPVRIGLLVLVVVLGLAYILWTNRHEIVDPSLDATAPEAAASDRLTGPPAAQGETAHE